MICYRKETTYMYIRIDSQKRRQQTIENDIRNEQRNQKKNVQVEQ